MNIKRTCRVFDLTNKDFKEIWSKRFINWISLKSQLKIIYVPNWNNFLLRILKLYKIWENKQYPNYFSYKKQIKNIFY